MKTYAKSILGIASVAAMAVAQSASAQSITQPYSVIPSPTLIPADESVSDEATLSGSASQDLSIDWEVTYSGGQYTYWYNVSNPASTGEYVFDLSIGGFNTGLLTGTSSANGMSDPNDFPIAAPSPGPSGWNYFTSPDGPTWGTANSSGEGFSPDPWSTEYPRGDAVPVPTAVQEPSTMTMMLGGACVALTFMRRKIGC
jgi:hypothetical protein